MDSHKKGQLMVTSLRLVLLLAVYFFIKLRHHVILGTNFFILVSFQIQCPVCVVCKVKYCIVSSKDRKRER